MLIVCFRIIPESRPAWLGRVEEEFPVTHRHPQTERPVSPRTGLHTPGNMGQWDKEPFRVAFHSHSSAGGLMGGFQPFQWFLHLKWTMIQIIQSTLGKKESPRLYALLCLTDAVRSKMERDESYSAADLPHQKWKGLVPCGQHSYFGTCPFEDGGGGGFWQWKFSRSLFCLLLSTGSDLV